MIRIVRGTAPEILTSEGVAAREALCARVDREGLQYRPRFEERIYGHASVYQALHHMQHGKCCYCERSIDRGAIDHFRPKSAVYQGPRQRVSERGYYWLVYAWENLLLACDDCNNRFKRQLFPLEDPDRRVLHHSVSERLADEAPLLLDPTLDEPELHITFRAFTPVALTGRGRATIELLRLDRRFLESERESVLSLVELLLVILETSRRGETIPRDVLQGACEQIVHYSNPTQAHAGMIRNTLRGRLGRELEFPLTHERLMRWAAEALPLADPAPPAYAQEDVGPLAHTQAEPDSPSPEAVCPPADPLG